MWIVATKRGPFKTKREACEHASLLMRDNTEIYEVGVKELLYWKTGEPPEDDQS